MNFSLNTDAV